MDTGKAQGQELATLAEQKQEQLMNAQPKKPEIGDETGEEGREGSAKRRDDVRMGAGGTRLLGVLRQGHEAKEARARG